VNNPAEHALSLRLNIPNVVTAVRIVLVVPIIWLLCHGGTGAMLLAAIMLCIAWATDGLDGFLARRLGQSTLGGALLDLIADRLVMTPIVILTIIIGLWSRTTGLMPFNPYPYAAIVIAGDLMVLAGVFSFIWKRRTRAIEFPAPPGIARITYSFQMLTLVVCVFGVGPDILLAALMYLTIIFTLLSFYDYLRKGSYVFTS